METFDDRPKCICGCGEPALYAKEHCDRKFASHIVNTDYAVMDMGHTTPCWIWKGRVTTGYRNTTILGKSAYVHRAMYEQVKGPIPAGLWIDHLCRVRCCCNPDHLEAVTPAVNQRRGLNIAKLDEEKVRYIHTSNEDAWTLAEKFGVARSAIWNVRRGHTWKEFHPAHDVQCS